MQYLRIFLVSGLFLSIGGIINAAQPKKTGIAAFENALTSYSVSDFKDTKQVKAAFETLNTEFDKMQALALIEQMGFQPNRFGITPVQPKKPEATKPKTPTKKPEVVVKPAARRPGPAASAQEHARYQQQQVAWQRAEAPAAAAARAIAKPVAKPNPSPWASPVAAQRTKRPASAAAQPKAKPVVKPTKPSPSAAPKTPNVLEKYIPYAKIRAQINAKGLTDIYTKLITDNEKAKSDTKTIDALIAMNLRNDNITESRISAEPAQQTVADINTKPYFEKVLKKQKSLIADLVKADQKMCDKAKKFETRRVALEKQLVARSSDALVEQIHQLGDEIYNASLEIAREKNRLKVQKMRERAQKLK